MLEIIKSRRSIHRFTGEKVESLVLNKFIEAGIWAPSGLNTSRGNLLLSAAGK
jgi:nitroreductase